MIETFVNGLSGHVQDSFLLAYAAVYLGGVLVSLTPCIYPLIPITVAFIGANGRGSKARSFMMAVTYVLGMAFTYTTLGVFAALSGMLFGQIQSSPWTHFFIGNLCIIMALSMMDLFSLRIRTPEFVTRVQMQKNVPGMMGSFLVGAASGLVISPCTAPALAVVLGYVATQQNVVFASSLLFVFALGMGTLLVLLGTFAGLLAGLPRSGAWTSRVSHLFGWILLGTGEYFLISAGMLWV